LVVRRNGSADPDLDVLTRYLQPERIDEIRSHQVDMPTVGFSSTEIRHRVASGRTIRYQTPLPVMEYIHQHGLYRHAEGEG
jgi:nicotinate-nucleotide adenylyltransferase